MYDEQSEQLFLQDLYNTLEKIISSECKIKSSEYNVDIRLPNDLLVRVSQYENSVNCKVIVLDNCGVLDDLWFDFPKLDNISIQNGTYVDNDGKSVGATLGYSDLNYIMPHTIKKLTETIEFYL